MADVEYTIDIDTKEALGDLRKLVNQMKGLEKQTKSNDAAFGGLSKGLVSLKGALAGVLGAAGIGALVKGSIDAADAIGKAADAASISTESLQEMRYAFGFAGIGAKDLDVSLAAFNKRLGRFVAEGGGAAKNALEALGLAAEITSGQLQGTGNVVDEAIERLALVEDEAARAGLAAGIFGDTLGPKLAAALKDGTAGIAELREEAHRMNQVIGEDSIRAAESLNDQFSKVTQAISGSFTKAITDAAPKLDELVKTITGNQETMQGLVDLTIKLAEAFVTAGGAAVSFAQDLGLIESTTAQQIQKVQEAIKGGFTDRLKFFGPEGIIEYYDEEELNQILRELQAKLKSEQEAAAAASAARAAERERVAASPETQDRLSKITTLPELKKQEEARKTMAKEAKAQAKAMEDAARKAKEAQERYNEELQSTLEMYSPVATRLKEIATAEKNLQVLRRAGTVSSKQMLEAEKNIALARRDLQRQQQEESRKWADGWSLAFEEYTDDATNAATQAREAFEASSQAMEDAVVNFAKTGKFEWKSYAQSVVDTLLQQQAQILTGNLLGGIGSLFGGSKGGFAGFFANGGNIPAGQFGVVGERGPELVSGPANVTPMDGIGGGDITYNINAVDALSFKQMIARDPQFIYAVTEEGRRGLPSY